MDGDVVEEIDDGIGKLGEGDIVMILDDLLLEELP